MNLTAGKYIEIAKIFKEQKVDKFWVVDDWADSVIKILRPSETCSSQELLFAGSRRDCEDYIESLVLDYISA